MSTLKGKLRTYQLSKVMEIKSAMVAMRAMAAMAAMVNPMVMAQQRRFMGAGLGMDLSDMDLLGMNRLDTDQSGTEGAIRRGKGMARATAGTTIE